MRSHRLFTLSLVVFASALLLGLTGSRTRPGQSQDWPLHSAAPGFASSDEVGMTALLEADVASKQPVVVELFTSEGCSSCPLADSFLKKLVEQQPFPNLEIIALEEHVDYWNHDGWFDPFSSPEFTGRQQDYASHFPKDAGTYTPQMIIDGRTQLVGSHVQEALADIRAVSTQPMAVLQLNPTGTPNEHTRSYEVRGDASSASSGASSKVDLWIAVTEKGLHSNVNAGENAGHALEHAPVVRYLHKQQSVTLPLSSPVSFTVKVDKKWNAANLAVVAFISDSHSHQIVAAGSSSQGAQLR